MQLLLFGVDFARHNHGIHGCRLPSRKAVVIHPLTIGTERSDLRRFSCFIGSAIDLPLAASHSRAALFSEAAIILAVLIIGGRMTKCPL